MDFNFRVIQFREDSANNWLQAWAARYDLESDDFDKEKYEELIERKGNFSPDDYKTMGWWKDNVRSEGRWKENVALVAYRIWTAQDTLMLRCPDELGIRDFLDTVSQMEYTDQYASGPRTKQFGFSRATTILHFLSVGMYPIFDSRVAIAVLHISDLRPRKDGSLWYVERFLPYYHSLASECQTSNQRQLDKALFTYGAFLDSTWASSFSIPEICQAETDTID
jgi:hypothetical protein